MRPVKGDAARYFAVKGVFRIVTKYRSRRRRPSVVYESRIVVVPAPSERSASLVVAKRLKADEWTAEAPAADIVRQTCSFIGLSKVLALGGEMDPGEVWYEFTDGRPSFEPPSLIGTRSRRRAK